MKRLGMLSVLLLVASAAAAQEAPRERPPIIDMHLHAFTLDSPGEPGSVHPGTGLRAPATSEDFRQETFALLERYNIVKAVTSGPLAVVERWRAADPERIIGSPLFPLAADDGVTWPSLEELRSGYRTGKLGAMGEITAQYVGISPSDPALEPYFALAEELDIPVGIHTGLAAPRTPYQCCPKFRLALGNPLLLEELLLKHPKLRVYIMHGGHPYLAETIAIMHMYPQVYTDLAVIDWVFPREWFHNYLRQLVQAGFGKRLMFGSDQLIWPQTIAIENIESADFLTAEQKRDIFYNNAVRFLRLDQKEQ